MFVDPLIDALRPLRFRGKGRLLGPLVSPSGRKNARVFGYRLNLELDDHIQRNIYLGTYEPSETRTVLNWLRPGMTFVDIGANIGYFTFLAASIVGPAGRVFAVEPGPGTFAQLESSVAENHLGVEIHNIGLSDHPGELPLYLPSEHLHNNSPTMVEHAEMGRKVMVPVRTLDQCLDDWDVGSVDLLKMDVEGHEPRVLSGGENSLRSGRIKAILCEFNDFWLRQAGSSPRELHDTLIQFGFDPRDEPHEFPTGCIETLLFTYRGPTA